MSQPEMNIDRPDEPRLDSWKGIAAYLQRNAVTARRWEREEGLPVHRHAHKSRSSVYAYPSEIDAWRRTRKMSAEPAPVRLWWRPLALGVTALLCLVMVGNGVRPQVVSAQQSDRSVWTGPHVDMFGRVSPDGRFITYVDWVETGNLMVHDVVANTDRALTASANRPSEMFSESAGFSTVSRDGAEVAYDWDDYRRDSHEIRITAMRVDGIHEPRRVFAGADDIRFLDPLDWSADKRWIASAIVRKDGTGQIALISITDGTRRVLKSVGWNVPERIFFSPDGKYIAYDLPASDSSDQRDIFVLAVDGSREVPVAPSPAEESLMGWSPDGKQLLFSSDRTGSVGLWAIQFANGRAQGAPELLRPDIGSSVISLGLTSAGTLYIYKGISSRDVAIATIDWNRGKPSGAPVSLSQGFLPGAKTPNWSPDGKYLSYSACDGHCLAVRSVETGQVRKVPMKLLYVRDAQWSPDGLSLLAGGRDPKGHDGMYRINVQTGETALVVPTENPSGGNPRWSPDGKSVYYYVLSKKAIVERNLESGAEREVIRHPSLHYVWWLSPDGRYLAAETGVDASTKRSSLIIISVTNSQTRELLRLADPESFILGSFNWTPDSRNVLVVKGTAAKPELWQVPADGAAPRKLDIDPNLWIKGGQSTLDSGFSLAPDGQRIAFLMGKSASEVWALENFLPKPAPAR